MFRRWMVLALIVAAAVASAVPLVAEAGSKTRSGTGEPGSPCTTQQSASRVAANIQASRGTPTPVGSLFLDAVRLGDLSGLPGARSQRDSQSYSVSSYIVATDATPSVARPAGSSEPSGATSSSRSSRTERSLSSTKRSAGATITYFSCGQDITANLIWYCAPVSSCTTRWYFWVGPAISRTGSCGPVQYSCQVYSYADPPYFDAVTYATMTQSAPGPPVVGDKWCSWG
jgi:hypothetical protein